MVPNGRRCGCGNDGCWEQYASGRALVAEARALASRAPQSAERMLKLAGGLPGGIDGPCVTTAAREGDEAALEAFRIVGTWLGRGIADLAAALDPGVFVLAGGVSSAGELLREPAWQADMARLTGPGYPPRWRAGWPSAGRQSILIASLPSLPAAKSVNAFGAWARAYERWTGMPSRPAATALPRVSSRSRRGVAYTAVAA